MRQLLLALTCAFLVGGIGILLHRTVGLREAAEPTLAWRAAQDARLAAMEAGLTAAREERAVMRVEIHDVVERADHLERMLKKLSEASKGSADRDNPGK